MNPQPHASSREVIVATAIQPVVRELRLIDIADYIAFIRLEHFSAIADLVDSAAELYFMPGAWRLGLGGEAHVCWTGSPRIVLDLELRPEGAVVYFQLSMTATNASVDIVLATLLVIGGVFGAQFGARAGRNLSGEQFRLLLALIVLAVAIRFAVDIVVKPEDLFSVGIAESRS